MKLDVEGFKKQIEEKKKAILLGVKEGFKNGQDYLENIMKFYIEETVYNVYTPVMYDRTYELRDNVTAKVVGNSIYVYVDSTGMDTTADGIPYPYRVLEGHKVHPYEHTPNDGSWAGYMNERNWVEATREEFISHMNQSQQFLQIVRDSIQKRI